LKNKNTVENIIDRKLSPRRRKGTALIMALVVVLIGSILSVFLFDMTFSFAWAAQLQQRGYVDHTTVVDAIQTTKGLILQTNLSGDGSGSSALHVPAVLSKDEITDLNALRFDGALSYDRTLGAGVGYQRLEMSVYDMCYDVDQLQDSLRSDPEQMKELPPPVKLPKLSFVAGGMSPEGDKNVGGTNEEHSGGNKNFPMTKYGAYLVRAKLFNIDKNGVKRLTRVAEEAFVQILE
jgi:hypothetical protein